MRLHALVLVASFAACLEPTEAKVELTTNADCKDFRAVTIDVGAGPVVRSTSCVDGRIGSVVLTPGSQDRVTVRAIASIGGDCPPTGLGPHCVVARRSVGYVKHKPLTLPIGLALDCLGVACDETTTCVHGLCVPATLDCTQGSCDVPSDCGDPSGLEAGAALATGGYCLTRVSRTPYSVPKPQSFNENLAGQGFNGTCSNPVIASDGTVYTACGDGPLYSYKNGAWAGAVGTAGTGGGIDPIAQPAIAADGAIISGGVDGIWDATKNAPIFKTGAQVTGAIAITSDGSIVFGAMDGKVYVVGRDGSLHYSAMVSPMSSVHVSIGPNNVVVGSGGSIVAAFNGPTATWTLDAGAQTTQVLVTPKGEAVFGAGNRLVLSTNGHERWGFTAPDVIGPPARGPDGTLYFACKDLKLYAVKGDGSFAWSSSFGGTAGTSASGAPVVGADGSVYVIGNTLVAAFDASSGALRWSQVASANQARPESTPVIGADGSMYFSWGSGIARLQ